MINIKQDQRRLAGTIRVPWPRTKLAILSTRIIILLFNTSSQVKRIRCSAPSVEYVPEKVNLLLSKKIVGSSIVADPPTKFIIGLTLLIVLKLCQRFAIGRWPFVRMTQRNIGRWRPRNKRCRLNRAPCQCQSVGQSTSENRRAFRRRRIKLWQKIGHQRSTTERPGSTRRFSEESSSLASVCIPHFRWRMINVTLILIWKTDDLDT